MISADSCFENQMKDQEAVIKFAKILINKHVNNLREKFSPGPGFEPESPALRSVTLTKSHPNDPLGQA